MLNIYKNIFILSITLLLCHIGVFAYSEEDNQDPIWTGTSVINGKRIEFKLYKIKLKKAVRIETKYLYGENQNKFYNYLKDNGIVVPKLETPSLLYGTSASVSNLFYLVQNDDNNNQIIWSCYLPIESFYGDPNLSVPSISVLSEYEVISATGISSTQKNELYLFISSSFVNSNKSIVRVFIVNSFEKNWDFPVDIDKLTQNNYPPAALPFSTQLLSFNYKPAIDHEGAQYPIYNLNASLEKDGAFTLLCNASVNEYYPCVLRFIAKDNKWEFVKWLKDQKVDEYLQENFLKEQELNKRLHDNLIKQKNTIINESLLNLNPSPDEIRQAFENLSEPGFEQKPDLALLLLGCLGNVQINDIDEVINKYALCLSKLEGDSRVGFLPGWKKYDATKNNIYDLCCTNNILSLYFRFLIIHNVQSQLQKADNNDPSFQQKAIFVKNESVDVIEAITEVPLKCLLSGMAGNELTQSQKEQLLSAKKMILSNNDGVQKDNSHKKPEHGVRDIDGIPLSLLTTKTTNPDVIRKYFVELGSITDKEIASGFALILLSAIDMRKEIPFLELQKWYTACTDKIDKNNPIGNKILPYWIDYNNKLKSKIYNADCTDQMLEIYFRSKILAKLSQIATSGNLSVDKSKSLENFIKTEAGNVLSKWPQSPMRIYLKAFTENPYVKEKDIVIRKNESL